MRIILLAGAMLLPVSAYAWETKAPAPVPAAVTPAPVASPSVSSTSSSTSKAKASNHVTINNTNQSGSRPAGSGGGADGYRGGNDARAPDVIGVPLVGANNCAVGLTLGGSGPSAGGLLGILWEGSACARNRDATLLNNMGLRPAGIELLCDTTAIRQAMYRSGTPCRKDIDQYGDAWRKQGWRP